MHTRLFITALIVAIGLLPGACGQSPIEDLQEARRLMATGGSEEAIALYKKVIAAHPEEAEAHARLAEIYLDQGKSDLAKPHVDQAIALAPEASATNYVRARVLLNDRLWLQAQQALDLASREDLFNPNIQFWQGVALGRLGEYDKSVLAFQKVLNMKSDFPGVHRQLADLHFLRESYDLAMQEYEQAIEESPDDLDILKNLALSYHYQQFNDSAVKTVNRLLEKDKKSATAYNILGAVAYGEGDIDGAYAHFQKAIELDPKLTAAHVNLGAIYNAKGEIDKSLEAYNQALALDPANIQVKKNLGDLYFTKGDIPKALEYYLAYNEVRPKDPFVAYLAAKLIALSKDADLDQGHELLDKMERASGLDVAMNEARFLMTTKRGEPNGDRLNMLYRKYNYIPDALAVRALLYERMDDYKRAEETIRIALLMNLDRGVKASFEKRLETYKRGEKPPSPVS